MRFVPVKSEDRQALLMMHKARVFLVRQQTRPEDPASRPGQKTRIVNASG
jgi:hypothetical protein